MAVQASSSIGAHVPVREIQKPQESEPKDPPLGSGSAKNAVPEPRVSSEAMGWDVTPEMKTWEKYRELQILPNAKVLYHSNGTISYSCFNTVTTWEYKNQKFQVSSFGSHNITALAESPTGELMIGNERGDLWIGSEFYDQLFSQSILAIIPIHKELFLIRMEQSTSVFNIKEITTLFKIEISSLRDIFPIGNNLLVALQYSKLKIWRIDNEKTAVEELRYEDTSLSKKYYSTHFASIKKISDTTLFLCRSDGEYLVWDVTTGKHDEFSKFPFENSVLQLGKGRFAVGDCDIWGRATRFFPSKEGYIQVSANKGGSASHLTLLSDGSILFANPSRDPSIIYIATKEGKKIFSQELSRGKVISLTELKDGSIAAQLEPLFKNMILILKPHKKHDQDQLANPPLELGKHQSDTGIEAPSLHQESRLKKKGEDTLQLDSSRKRKRLHIGDGTFDYTEAVITKYQNNYPDLPQTLTATELSPPNAKTRARVEALVNQGVNVFFGIDGQQIHQLFNGERFERIQWNFPHTENPQETLPNFFRSSSALQLPGDRIHVTLVQEPPSEDQESSQARGIWRQKENPIVKAATAANYCLKRKRDFGPHRYPGYVHMKNNREPYVYSEGSEPREFIFEKAPPIDDEASDDLTRAKKLRDRSKKHYEIKTNIDPAPDDLGEYYFECSTDEDSSDGYQSE